MGGASRPRAGGAEAPAETATAAFHTAVPTFGMFEAIGNPDLFVPLPDDWIIGLADVVASTAAIAEGRYKAVNTAGASVISAVANALGTLDFPFLFAGDGASFAVGPAEAAAATATLSATVAWVGEALGLALRGGVVSVRAIRREGLDVRVARFAASADAAYAMFSGGGLGWAEQQLKQGGLDLPPPVPGARPDLTGLSCRFQDLKSKHGVIVSILARPGRDASDPRFAALVARILATAARGPDAGRPIPVFTPLGGINLRSIALNARLARRAGETWLGSLARAGLLTALISFLFTTRLPLGSFSARRYLDEVIANTDFRKYDDGLMMTVDCTIAAADEIEAGLAAAEREGIVRYGTHRQSAATVTCVVPSATRPNHVHFIDGAAGGYAMAARALKSQLVAADGV